jgi:hypothetical protein
MRFEPFNLGAALASKEAQINISITIPQIAIMTERSFAIKSNLRQTQAKKVFQTSGYLLLLLDSFLLQK